MSESSKKRRRYASRSRTLREAMMAAVSPRDVYEITKLQVFLALKGDPLAAREVLDRTVGRAVSVAELVEMESRETPMAEREIRSVTAEEVRLMIESVPLIEGKADGGAKPTDVETGSV